MTLVFLVALVSGSLVLGSGVVANTNDSLILDNQSQGLRSQDPDANSMTWPMLPGESLEDIARLFYPKNKAMQKQFVFKTLRLNADNQPNLNPSERFESPTLLVIPTLKSLSNGTRAIKSGRHKSNKQKLYLSYRIKPAVENVPAKLMQDYELLLGKNAFLKEELAKLNEKLVFLQTKLNELKLILDKTLSLPKMGMPNNSLPTSKPPTDKVFKNLNKPAIDKSQASMPEKSATSSLFAVLNNNLLMAVLALGLLAVLSVYLLKKYRQYMYSKISFVATKMQATKADIGGHWQNTLLEARAESAPEVAPLVQVSKEVESRLNSTFEEAKLLMSINRTSDAIAHLKLTIKAHPKAAINHWLYLLEIFKKLNIKEDFESYAKDLHDTFNVISPIWQETEIAMVVPQRLEEFPHIMEKLYSTWPGDSATVYLRSLITDNRGGERTGFGKAVLSEILLLIALLDVRKDLI